VGRRGVLKRANAKRQRWPCVARVTQKPQPCTGRLTKRNTILGRAPKTKTRNNVAPIQNSPCQTALAAGDGPKSVPGFGQPCTMSRPAPNPQKDAWLNRSSSIQWQFIRRPRRAKPCRPAAKFFEHWRGPFRRPSHMAEPYPKARISHLKTKLRGLEPHRTHRQSTEPGTWCGPHGVFAHNLVRDRPLSPAVKPGQPHKATQPTPTTTPQPSAGNHF